MELQVFLTVRVNAWPKPGATVDPETIRRIVEGIVYEKLLALNDPRTHEDVDMLFDYAVLNGGDHETT